MAVDITPWLRVLCIFCAQVARLRAWQPLPRFLKADEEPRSSEQQEPEQAAREPCPSDQWRRLGYQALPEITPQDTEASGAPSGVMQVPTAAGRTT